MEYHQIYQSTHHELPSQISTGNYLLVARDQLHRPDIREGWASARIRGDEDAVDSLN